MQLVVPSAVRNAVSAATITFTASSITLCFFMILSPFFCHTDLTDLTDLFFALQKISQISAAKDLTDFLCAVAASMLHLSVR